MSTSYRKVMKCFRKKNLAVLLLAVAVTFTSLPHPVRGEVTDELQPELPPDVQTEGWLDLPDGERQYLIDGVYVTGLQKIDQSYYFFDGNGFLQKNTWKTIDGRKYYFKSSGKAATGSYKVDGQYYVFNTVGKRLSSKKLKITKLVNGAMYCVDAKGRPRKGWQIIKKKLYYVNGKGEILRSAARQGITLTKDGSAKDDTNAKLKIKVMQVLDAITTSKMSKKEKLRKCFSYTIGSTFRYNRAKWPNFTIKTWWRKCALDMLNEKQGVCFGYACAFAALAEELGYTPYLVDANLPARHCWVRIDGKFYDRLTNSFGASVYPRSYTVNRIIKF